MIEDKKYSDPGIGFFGWLTLLLIGLKLTGYIYWSWWTVLFFMWAPALLIVAIIILQALLK